MGWSGREGRGQLMEWVAVQRRSPPPLWSWKQSVFTAQHPVLGTPSLFVPPPPLPINPPDKPAGCRAGLHGRCHRGQGPQVGVLWQARHLCVGGALQHGHRRVQISAYQRQQTRQPGLRAVPSPAGLGPAGGARTGAGRLCEDQAQLPVQVRGGSGALRRLDNAGQQVRHCVHGQSGQHVSRQGTGRAGRGPSQGLLSLQRRRFACTHWRRVGMFPLQTRGP